LKGRAKEAPPYPQVSSPLKGKLEKKYKHEKNTHDKDPLTQSQMVLSCTVVLSNKRRHEGTVTESGEVRIVLPASRVGGLAAWRRGWPMRDSQAFSSPSSPPSLALRAASQQLGPNTHRHGEGYNHRTSKRSFCNGYCGRV